MLITGGSGFFGQHFTRLLLATEKPQSVRIMARSEHQLAAMERRFDDGRLRMCKGDIRDYDRLLEVTEGVNIIIHAAALKRVEGAQDASETVKVNVEGSRNVVRAATERHVERVMGISSDKACQASTLYGATKLVMEQLFMEPHGRSRTAFGICRYGNVVGSSGSVIPLWREQARDGYITITDPRCTRFWITAEQAVAWVKRRIELMEPGYVYVPILPSARMVDVAEAVVGSTVGIRVTGMRGLEKLHEAMIGFDESRTARRGIGEPLAHYMLGGDPTGAAEFTYASDTNTRWLSVSEIRAMLPDVAA